MQKQTQQQIDAHLLCINEIISKCTPIHHEPMYMLTLCLLEYGALFFFVVVVVVVCFNVLDK